MKYDFLISHMTLEEKASLMSGADFWHTAAIERLGIPSVMMTDGPHGLRKQSDGGDHLGLGKSVPATCYPTASALANSWDETLVEELGQYYGMGDFLLVVYALCNVIGQIPTSAVKWRRHLSVVYSLRVYMPA